MTNARPRPLASLLVDAGFALTKSQEGIGQLLGVSRRTVSRWTSDGGGHITPDQGATLARALAPVDAALAAEAAVWAKTSVETLTPGPSPRLAQAVLCAAADVLDVSPRAARPVLLAAFRAAREEGLTVEAVAASLEAMEAPLPATKAAAKANR